MLIDNLYADSSKLNQMHDDVIKSKHFPRYLPFVRGIHRSPVNSPHKGQWRGALMFSLISFWINGCVNNREAGDLRRYRAHYDVTVMWNHSRATKWYECCGMSYHHDGAIHMETFSALLALSAAGRRWITLTGGSNAEPWCSLCC